MSFIVAVPKKQVTATITVEAATLDEYKLVDEYNHFFSERAKVAWIPVIDRGTVIKLETYKENRMNERYNDLVFFYCNQNGEVIESTDLGAIAALKLFGMLDEYVYLANREILTINKRDDG